VEFKFCKAVEDCYGILSNELIARLESLIF